MARTSFIPVVFVLGIVSFFTTRHSSKSQLALFNSSLLSSSSTRKTVDKISLMNTVESTAFGRETTASLLLRSNEVFDGGTSSRIKNSPAGADKESSFGGSSVISDEENAVMQNRQQMVDLPLLPWEERSINGTCAPPPGIPRECCLRSTSAGGSVGFNPSGCPPNASLYENVKNHTLKHLSLFPVYDNGNEDSDSCDMCRIVDTMLKYNLSMTAHGDSLMTQTISGLTCELARRGYITTNDIEQDAKLIDPRNVTVGWRYKMNTRTTITIRQHPDDVTPDKNYTGNVATILYFRIYRVNIHLLWQHVRGYESDIFMFDHSLHYRYPEMDKFHQEMTLLLENMISTNNAVGASYSPPKLIMWREQITQHFQAPGGHYYEGAKQCSPLSTNHSSDYNYRHLNTMHRVVEGLNMTLVTDPRDLRKVAVDDGDDHNGIKITQPPQVYLVPFRNFTKPLWDIHAKGECTHVCSTPYFWLSTWRHIRLALDRLYY